MFCRRDFLCLIRCLCQEEKCGVYARLPLLFTPIDRTVAFPHPEIKPKWTPEKTNDYDVDPQARLIQSMCTVYLILFCDFLVMMCVFLQDGQAEASVSVAVILGLMRNKDDMIYEPRQFRGLIRLDKEGREARPLRQNVVETVCYYARCYDWDRIVSEFTGYCLGEGHAQGECGLAGAIVGCTLQGLIETFVLLGR